MTDINMTMLSQLSPEAQSAMIWQDTLTSIATLAAFVIGIGFLLWFMSKGV